MESVHKIFLFTFLISTFLSLIQRLPKGSQRTSPQNKNAMNKRCVHSFMACQIQVRYTVSPPHDSIYSSSIDTMIALHSCDSPQDLLRTAQGTRSGQPVPFGSVPFPCAAVLPGLWPRGTDKHRTSIQSYLSIYTFLSSLGRKVNRYLFTNILLLLSHSLFPLKAKSGPAGGSPPAGPLYLRSLFRSGNLLFFCSVQSNEFLQILVSLFCFLLVLSEHYGSFLRVGSYK